MSTQLDKVQPKNKIQLEQLIGYAFKHNIYDLNFIDTSEITDMSWLFDNVNHNFDISSWDVSNVTNMEFMFYYCYIFDSDLSNWNVSNVKDMSYMFTVCENFKGKGLENWDVSKVEDMKYMFGGCDKITIPNWYKL